MTATLAGGAAAMRAPCHLTAFGLTLESSELSLITAVHGTTSAAASRLLTIERADADPISGGRHRDAVDVMLERHLPDGSLGMRVERLTGGGYSIYAPGFGGFEIAADGSAVRCSAVDTSDWQWQRPLFGQAVPLAATLRGGLELLHASAVALDGRVAAFVGRSGAGKTSLATHLTARGGLILCDDVLSLEVDGDQVMAHPGIGMANIAAEQFESLTPDGQARLGRPIGRSEKIHVRLASMPSGPLPLSALYFVERGLDVASVTFEEIAPPDPRRLLGSTFMPHVVTAERLMTQLHTCAAVAERVPAYRIAASWQHSADQIAAAVEQHAAATA